MEQQKIDEFVRESWERHKEAKALAEKLGRGIEGFGTQCELRVSEVFRQKMVEEVEQIVRETMAKAAQKEDELRRWPSLYRGQETWVSGFVFEAPGGILIGFGADKFKSDSAWAVAAGMEEKHDIRYLPVEEFKQRTEKLKSLLLNGDLDDILRMDAKRVVYEIMSSKGKLWPRVQPD